MNKKLLFLLIASIVILGASTINLLVTNNTWTGSNTFSGLVVIGATITHSSVYDNGNSGSSKTINFANGQHQKITLNDSPGITISAPGVGIYYLRIVQDGTGNRTITWITSMYWPNGLPIVLSTAGGSIDRLAIEYDGTNCWVSYATDYSTP